MQMEQMLFIVSISFFSEEKRTNSKFVRVELKRLFTPHSAPAGIHTVYYNIGQAMRFMVLVIYSKGVSIVECDDRNISNQIVLPIQEVPGAEVDVFGPSGQSTINASTPGINLHVFFDGCF